MSICLSDSNILVIPVVLVGCFWQEISFNWFFTDSSSSDFEFSPLSLGILGCGRQGTEQEHFLLQEHHLEHHLHLCCCRCCQDLLQGHLSRFLVWAQTLELQFFPPDFFWRHGNLLDEPTFVVCPYHPFWMVAWVWRWCSTSRNTLDSPSESYQTWPVFWVCLKFIDFILSGLFKRCSDFLLKLVI